MAGSLIIKVTYEGITRRFHEDVDENGNLGLDMIGLKDRIFSLFGIPTGSDVSITYVDDGNDVVNLVDDADLQEVMAQNLECLKITVLKNENEQLLQQNQIAEGSNGGQPDAELVLNGETAARLLQYEPRGEEEDGSQIMTMSPHNVSGDLNWIQAVVPSLGDLLTNLSIPVWLKTVIRWSLTLIVRLPWRRIFERAYSFISFLHIPRASMVEREAV